MTSFEYTMARDLLLDILVDVRLRTYEYELSDNVEEAEQLRELQAHLAHSIQYCTDELEELDERGG
jgi:hypothetical protein